MRIVLLLLLALAPLPATAAQDGARVARRASPPGTFPLTLESSADRESYLPGEPVHLRFRVVNNSDRSASLDAGSNVETGRLRVFIAYGDGEYLEYIGPRWGLNCAIYLRRIVLDGEKSFFETKATVLWNHRFETAHLTEAAARRITKGRITSSYALPRPGAYRIKAVLDDPGNGARLVSEPLLINVEEPAGADVEIWDVIKGDGHYGHFLQTGHFGMSDDSLFVQEAARKLDSLAAAYPDSRYSAHIRDGLGKYKELLEKVKDAKRKREPLEN